VPLEIRSLTGNAAVESLGVSVGERLAPLDDVAASNQYAEKLGTCGPYGPPAFKGIAWTEEDAPTQVLTDPWGVMVGRAGFFPESHLQPGSDTYGSISLYLRVGPGEGTLIVDSSCVAPANHLSFYDPNNNLTKPVFVPGLVSIADCKCSHHGDIDGSGFIDATDLALLIDWVYFAQGPPPKDSACPHIDRGDVNCDGQDDVVDVSLMIDHVSFGGPPPCDPCSRDPYPVSCE